MLAPFLLVLAAQPDSNRVGESYCGPALANSTGEAAEISAFGTGVAGEQLQLLAVNLPRNQNVLFITSQSWGHYHIPFAQGFICVDGNQMASFRCPGQVVAAGPDGRASIAVDTNSIPYAQPVSILPGETWYFQAWFRDPAQVLAPSAFTDAVEISFL